MSEQATTTDTQAQQRPAMWTPEDGPGDSNVEGQEPIDAEDTQDIASEEDTGGEATDDARTEDGSGQEAAGQHNLDKGLQKLQQRMTVIERQTQQQLSGLQKTLEKLVESQQPKDEASSKAEASKAQEQAQATEDLEALLAELEEDAGSAGDEGGEDFATQAELRKHLRERNKKVGDVLRRLTKAYGRNNPIVEQMQSRIEQLTEKVEQAERLSRQQAELAEQQRRAEQYWASFKSEHGFDGQSLWAQAQKDAVEQVGEHASDEAVFGAAKLLFNQRVEARKKQLAEGKGKTPDARRTPRESTEGTQTVPQGASSNRPSTQRKPAKPPMYVPD